MSITFDVVEAPTKVAEKDITTNPYWPVIEAIKDTDGKAARFAIPTQEGDDFKRSTGRVRGKLNEVSDHIKRTIRASFEEKDGTTYATVWVMGKKITRAKKDETPAVTPAETPADTETAPAEAVLAPAEAEKSGRRSRRS